MLPFLCNPRENLLFLITMSIIQILLGFCNTQAYDPSGGKRFFQSASGSAPPIVRFDLPIP